ncbi:MAG: hypothetical protein NHB32_03405 [Fischerella sp. CENA71]|nr:hypothetical protein [Fischerella sp. CENA71]
MRFISFSQLLLVGLFSTGLSGLVFFNLSNTAIAAPKVSKVNTLAFMAIRRSTKFEVNIYTTQTNGSNRHQLTQNLDITPTIVWSNNGKRIAFLSNETDIYTMNADGSQLTKIFSGSYCKASEFRIKWLLNDQKLAFTRSCDGSTYDTPGNVSLYLSDTTGTKGTKLIQQWQVGGIPPKTEISSSLYLSPNGQQVVFFKDKSIFQMSTNGSNLTELTKAPGDDFPSELVWSPNGTQIAFSYGKDRNQSIYLLNIKNKTLTNLSNEPRKTAYSGLISWSPDGTQLAYYHDQGSKQFGTELDIFVFNVAQKTVRKLISKPGEYSELQWSLDSKQIAFTSGDFSEKKLYILSIDELKLTELAAQLPPSKIDSLTWSLDGQQLAFIKEGKTNEESDSQSILYVVNRDGSKLIKLSNSDDLFIASQTWQP